jgi:hypothetical protein
MIDALILLAIAPYLWFAGWLCFSGLRPIHR